MPKRGGRIAGSLNEARWLYAPTGRKGIAQGKAKRRPEIRYVIISVSPERAAQIGARHPVRPPGRMLANREPKSVPGTRCAAKGEFVLLPLLTNDVSGKAKGIHNASLVVGFSDNPNGGNRGPEPCIWGKDSKATWVAKAGFAYGSAHRTFRKSPKRCKWKPRCGGFTGGETRMG